MAWTIGPQANIAQIRGEVAALRAELEALQPKLERQRNILQMQIGLLNTSLSLTRRLTGDENIERGIGLLQKALTVVRQLQIASTLLVATNPWLVALGLIGVVGMTLTMNDMLGGY